MVFGGSAGTEWGGFGSVGLWAVRKGMVTHAILWAPAFLPSVLFFLIGDSFSFEPLLLWFSSSQLYSVLKGPLLSLVLASGFPVLLLELVNDYIHLLELSSPLDEGGSQVLIVCHS